MRIINRRPSYRRDRMLQGDRGPRIMAADPPASTPPTTLRSRLLLHDDSPRHHGVMRTMVIIRPGGSECDRFARSLRDIPRGPHSRVARRCMNERIAVLPGQYRSLGNRDARWIEGHPANDDGVRRGDRRGGW